MVTGNTTREYEELVASGAVKGRRLKECDAKWISEYVGWIEKTDPKEVETIILYGSVARGDWKKYSDIDIAMILSTEDESIGHRIMSQGCEIGARLGAVPEVMTFGRKEWNETVWPLYRAKVVREGITLFNRQQGKERRQ